ncbi:MAG TPA: hypothetical protein VIY49_23800 [Bryobacteraceae bacterium]
MNSKTLILCAVAAVFVASTAVRGADQPTTKAQGKTASPQALGKAETLAGTIMMVDQESNVVVVKDSKGTTFDIVVTKATRLRAGDQPVHLKDLTTDTKKPVTVKFVPERSGDIAQSIKVIG